MRRVAERAREWGAVFPLSPRTSQSSRHFPLLHRAWEDASRTRVFMLMDLVENGTGLLDELHPSWLSEGEWLTPGWDAGFHTRAPPNSPRKQLREAAHDESSNAEAGEEWRAFWAHVGAGAVLAVQLIEEIGVDALGESLSSVLIHRDVGLHNILYTFVPTLCEATGSSAEQAARHISSSRCSRRVLRAAAGADAAAAADAADEPADEPADEAADADKESAPSSLRRKFWLIDFGLGAEARSWMHQGQWRVRGPAGNCVYMPPAAVLMLDATRGHSERLLTGPSGGGGQLAFADDLRQYRDRLDHYALGVTSLFVLFNRSSRAEPEELTVLSPSLSGALSAKLRNLVFRDARDAISAAEGWWPLELHTAILDVRREWESYYDDVTRVIVSNNCVGFFDNLPATTFFFFV